jgi:hypothetical protein
MGARDGRHRVPSCGRAVNAQAHKLDERQRAALAIACRCHMLRSPVEPTAAGSQTPRQGGSLTHMSTKQGGAKRLAAGDGGSTTPLSAHGRAQR